MAQSDLWKRYVEAGIEFTQMSRQRAEAVVKDLVKAGEVQREQAQDWVEDLLDKSRRNTESLVELVRREVKEQLEAFGLVPAGAKPKAAATTATSTAKSAGAKKATGTKTATKKAPTAAKSAAKKASTATKATAKTAAKKTAKTATATKTTAKKAAAKGSGSA